MNQRQIFDYYSREDIQEELLRLAKNKEIVGVFRNGSYGERPNTFIYPQDIISTVKSGSVEFHFSLEYWKNPIQIKKTNYEQLRSGFDFILDIDCKDTEHGKIAANLFIKELNNHGIKNIGLKFSGGTGFHIAVPWSSIPNKVDYQLTAKQYPDLPRLMASYLKSRIRKKLENTLLSKYDIEKLAEQTGKPVKDFITKTGIAPYKIVDIDPILISPRHLVRMPYSLNRNTFLVSMPLKIEQLEDFKREDANPENIKSIENFLPKSEPDETELLISQTIDWRTHNFVKEEKKIIKRAKLNKAIPLEVAPPCIKNILKGLPEGKKRSVFVLINYLSSTGWKQEDMERVLLEWNNKNSPPLQENYIMGQLRYGSEKQVAPPNCIKPGYYIDIEICQPDIICGGENKTIKNPVNYPFKKLGIGKKNK